MERCTCKVVVLLIKPLVSRCRPVVGSIDMVGVNCQNWPIIGDTKTAYHLDGKPGNFGENSNGLFIPEEIFREKSNTFRDSTFFRFYRKTEIFCTICLDNQCQALSRERAKNLPVFCKWYNSIPFLFLEKKKIPVPFDGKFRPKFPYKW